MRHAGTTFPQKQGPQAVPRQVCKCEPEEVYFGPGDDIFRRGEVPGRGPCFSNPGLDGLHILQPVPVVQHSFQLL